MERDIKLIAVDMDGTFLDSTMNYNREVFYDLYQCMKAKGIHFVVASGNQYYQLKSFFGDIQDELTYVAENGAYIIDNKEELFSVEIEKNHLQEILDNISGYPEIEICVCGKKSAYILAEKEQFYQMCSAYYHRLALVPSFDDLDDQIIKLALLVPGDKTVELTEILTKKIGHLIKPVNSGHGSIDLIVPIATKGHGIKLLCERWGLLAEQCMAFGDSDNDLEMLAFVAHSYAMENGRDIVKQTARYEAPNHNQEGVLTILKELLL